MLRALDLVVVVAERHHHASRQVAQVARFWRPEDTKRGRQAYHGQWEVFFAASAPPRPGVAVEPVVQHVVNSAVLGKCHVRLGAPASKEPRRVESTRTPPQLFFSHCYDLEVCARCSCATERWSWACTHKPHPRGWMCVSRCARGTCISRCVKRRRLSKRWLSRGNAHATRRCHGAASVTAPRPQPPHDRRRRHGTEAVLRTWTVAPCR